MPHTKSHETPNSKYFSHSYSHPSKKTSMMASPSCLSFHASSLIIGAVFLFFCMPQCAALALKKHKIDSPTLTENLGINRTIIVDINGNGHFKSVQAAIDSIPEGNTNWVIVHLRKGIFREKVHIPETKPYIFMRGNGRGKSGIVWSQSSEDNVASATFRVEAHDFIAFGISFKNEAPTGIAYTSQNQSVAAFVAADKVAFYHCAFYSTHNTLFDYKGRHYFDSCYIQGSIDFIFGRARSIYYNADIFVVDDKRVKIKGSVTAQNRESEGDMSGFIFIKGKVYGIGGVYLGRAKGPYSRVIFAETYLSMTIVAEGWTNWSYNGSTKNLYHSEYKCKGPGSSTARRVPWARQLTKDEAAPFMSIDYIDGKNWLPAWDN